MTTRSETEALDNPISALMKLHDMLCDARTRGRDFDLAHAYKLCLRAVIGFSGPQFDQWVDEWERNRRK